MQVDTDVKVPATAIAALMAPDLVNDRYIQLDPVYRHGAVMANDAVIPMNRTALPQSVDQTISLLDQLIQALGPTGANKNGALSQFVHDVAQTVGQQRAEPSTPRSSRWAKPCRRCRTTVPSITSLLDNAGRVHQRGRRQRPGVPVVRQRSGLGELADRVGQPGHRDDPVVAQAGPVRGHLVHQRQRRLHRHRAVERQLVHVAGAVPATTAGPGLRLRRPGPAEPEQRDRHRARRLDVVAHPLRPVARHEVVRPADLRQRADPDPRPGRAAGEELRAEPGLRRQRGAVADGRAAQRAAGPGPVACRR